MDKEISMIVGEMFLVEIEMANIQLIEVKEGTPHCKKHGAMNKITKFEDGGGIWRCVTTVSNQNENCCRAGAKQIGPIRNEEYYKQRTLEAKIKAEEEIIMHYKRVVK